MENQEMKQIENTSLSVFANGVNFELAQRIAKSLSASELVPKIYQGNIANTLIALEMAGRIGASPLMVMQHLNIIQGKPSWSSTFLISAINSSNRFDGLKYKFIGNKTDDTWGCIAWAADKKTGEVLEGAEVTIAMAKSEGWYAKNGSKWKTIPQLMLQYRAAAFFSRVYCPEITMGMQTSDEVIEIENKGVISIDDINQQKESDRVAEFIQSATTLKQLKEVESLVKQYDLMADYEIKKEELTNLKLL